MATQTLGQFLLADILPPDVYRPGQVIDKKSVKQIFGAVAKNYPDEYKDIMHRTVQLGKQVATSTGGGSFSVSQLATPPRAAERRRVLRGQLEDILTNVPEAKRNDAIIKLLNETAKTDKDETYREADEMGNPLALLLKGAGRGNPASLARILSSDLMYAGPDGKPIPIPVLRSYSQGLSPGAFAASTFGARKGISETKLSVASGGYLCLDGDTEVRLADGSTRAIKNIRAGDWVQGATITGETLPVRVQKLWRNGVKSVREYSLRLNGQRELEKVVMTKEHEVLLVTDAYSKLHYTKHKLETDVPYNRLPIAAIKKESRLGVAGPAVAWVGQQSESLAWIIGYLIGDGCLSNGKVRFATADPEVLRTMEFELSPFGFGVNRARADVEGRRDYEYAIVDQKPNQKRRGERGKILTGAVHRLKLRLESLGLMGKRSFEKTIPAEVWDWDKRSIAELLSGLFEADGCVHTTQVGTQTIVLAMTSEQVVTQVRELLRVLFGIHTTQVKSYWQPNATVQSDKMTNIPQTRRHIFVINITGYQSVSRFYAQISPGGCKLRQGKERFEAKSYKIKQKNSYCLVDWVEAGERPVFDLAVDHPDHLYVLANGLIVSNSKLLQSAAHRMVVTRDDAPADEIDPNDMRGLPVDTDDTDNVGTLLAKDVGPYKRNTTLTPKILEHLTKLGHDEILVRSPITTADPDGGVYGRDVGEQEMGRLPSNGSSVGVTAAAAVSEPITQSLLASKHTGGVAEDQQGLRGFDLIDKLFNTPQEFLEAASYSDMDGTVSNIAAAPQGGHYVYVGDKEHYVGPDKQLKVKKGQSVEAGDPLSSGPLNPRSVIEHKGLGEGARQLTYGIRDAIRESGQSVNRRNLELVVRGLVDRVRVTEEFDDYSPDDVVPYNQIASRWKPREGHRVSGLQTVAGRYLEKPVLHYTIGCFDSQTEALTSDGWLPWPEVTEDTLLATVDGNNLTFEKPLAVTHSPYKGEMLGFAGRYVDYLVTPNHRFYAARYHAPERRFRFETAEYLHGSRWRVRQYGLPQKVEHSPGAVIRIGERDIDYGDYAELLGWWVSEGSTEVQGNSSSVTIWQSDAVNPENMRLIESLAERLGYYWSPSTRYGEHWGVRIADTALGLHLRQYGATCEYKRLPRHLFNQSPEILARTYDAMMRGDGSVRHEPGNGKLTGRYNTSSPGLADDFQELCIRMGLGASIRLGRNRDGCLQEYYCGVAMNRDVAQVGGSPKVVAKQYYRVDYNGMVHCAEMRTGLLYVRRNGKPMVSGNSRVTPSVVARLQKHGVKQIATHATPPPFASTMVRATDLLRSDPDWQTRQIGTGLEKGLLEATHYGLESDEQGTSFVPARARAVDFNRTGALKLPLPGPPINNLGHQ